MKSFDIAGYTYAADTYCTGCILDALPTGEGGAFDGWRDMTGRMTPEQNLDELATAFGIDRYDESSYDSGEFPKVVFVDGADDDVCGACGEELLS